jgi:hypothetical protein
MPGKFYHDLLSGSDTRMGIDWSKDYKLKDDGHTGDYFHKTDSDPWTDTKMTLKAQPKKEVSMEVSQWKESEWKAKSASDQTVARK